MSTKIQELTRLVRMLKKVLPQGEGSPKADPFTCLRVHVLEYLVENKNIGMNELAKFLSITPPSATSIVNKLVRGGVISRVADKHDRRKVLLLVTPKGKIVLKKGKEHIEEHMGKIFSVLNAQELDQLIYLVKKLVNTHL
jgi:DNA-binding MarR family transcriptional regulator